MKILFMISSVGASPTREGVGDGGCDAPLLRREVDGSNDPPPPDATATADYGSMGRRTTTASSSAAGTTARDVALTAASRCAGRAITTRSSDAPRRRSPE